jgi:hypothetical protein
MDAKLKNRRRKMLQRKGLIILVVACFIVLQTTSFVSAAPSKGLVGHWHLDEGTGTVAADSSPEKNDGELWGDAKWETEGLSQGGGFTGVSLNLPSNSGLSIPAQGVESLEQITEGLTLAAWIKIQGEATDDQGNLIVKPGSYYLVYRDKKIGMYLYGPSSDGGLGYQTGKTVLPENKWIHVALSFTKGKEIALYLDGEVEWEDSGAGTGLDILTRDNEAFVGIGNERQKSRFFDGLVDDVVIYANVGLTQKEIQTDLIDTPQSVSPLDKLAVTWGTIKRDR